MRRLPENWKEHKGNISLLNAIGPGFRNDIA